MGGEKKYLLLVLAMDKNKRKRKERRKGEREGEEEKGRSTTSSSDFQRSNGWSLLDQGVKFICVTRVMLKELGILPTLVYFPL